MQGRIVSTAEVRRARRTDREGAPASAASAPPANELTSITPQLVAIGLHFPYRASHTHKVNVWTCSSGVWTAAHSASRETTRGRKVQRRYLATLIADNVFFLKIIWNCQKTSSSLRESAALMDAGEAGVRFSSSDVSCSFSWDIKVSQSLQSFHCFASLRRLSSSWNSATRGFICQDYSMNDKTWLTWARAFWWYLLRTWSAYLIIKVSKLHIIGEIQFAAWIRKHCSQGKLQERRCKWASTGWVITGPWRLKHWQREHNDWIINESPQ